MRARSLSLWLGIPLLFLLLLVGLLSLGPVQRALFLAFVPSGDGKVAVEKFRVGLSGVEVTGLSWVGPAATVRVPSATVRPDWASLWGSGPTRLRMVRAEQFHVQLPPPDSGGGSSTAAAAAASGEGGHTDAPGSAWELPREWEPLLSGPPLPVLANLDLQGTLGLPDGGELTVNVRSNFGENGESGDLQLTVQPDETAAALFPKVDLDATVGLDGKARIRSLQAKGEVVGAGGTAEGRGFGFQARYTPDDPQDWLQLTLTGRPDGQELVAGTLARPEGQWQGDLRVDLTELAGRPFLDRFPRFSQGELTAVVRPQGEGLAADVKVAELVPAGTTENYSLDLQATTGSADGFPVDGSFRLTDARDKASSFDFSARRGDAEELQVSVKGPRLEVAVLQEFAAPWQEALSGAPSAARDEAVGKPEGAPASEETAAASNPLAGLPFPVSAEVAFTEVVLPDFPAVRNLGLQADASAEKADINLSADWQEDSGIRVTGSLQSPEEGPVDAQLSASFTDLAVGPLLQLLQPDQTPQITGIFTLQADLAGSAASLQALPAQLTGSVDLQGRDGVVRSLRPEERITQYIRAGSVITSIFGQGIDRPGVEALSEVVRLFQEIPFDRLQVSAQREASARTTFDPILFQGPYLALQGKGRIAAGPLDEVENLSMNLELAAGSRPPLTRPLSILGLSGPAPEDPDAYRPWVETIRLSGSLAEPNTSQLTGMLITAVTSAATKREKDLSEEQRAPREKSPEEELLEEGARKLFDLFGG
jgi:hypothetical protein